MLNLNVLKIHGAITNFKRALKIAPDFAIAYMNWGIILFG
jgi:hypothetical protein